MSILNNENFKLCAECKHYSVESTKLPCSSCLPHGRQSPLWEAIMPKETERKEQPCYFKFNKKAVI